MRILRQRLKVFFCLLVILGLLTNGESKGETRKVFVSVPCPCTGFFPFYLANEKGYYAQEGLHVDVVVMSGVLGVQALLGREVQVHTGTGSGLSAGVRGAPVRVIFSTLGPMILWLHSKPEIRSIKELKGKKVAIASAGGATSFLTEQLLERHGLKGRRDVTLLSLGRPSTRYAALASGTVDAAVTTAGFLFRAEKAGFRRLASYAKEGFVNLAGSIVVTEQFLKSEPVLLEKFVRATLKALLYARSNRTGTIPVLAKMAQADQATGARLYDIFLPGMTKDGTADREMQKKQMEPILHLQKIKEPPPLEKYFDYSLTRKALAELKAKGWKPDGR